MNGIFTLVTPYIHAIQPEYIGVAILATNTAWAGFLYVGQSGRWYYGGRLASNGYHPIATPVLDWIYCY